MERINNEIYVSLEVAKLLKEAKFDWECYKIYYCYFKDDNKWALEDNHNNHLCILKLDYCLLAPTLDITQRWIREIKNIEINILCVYIHHVKKYSYTVFTNEYEHEIVGEGFNTYEEAQEEGIKKALKIILKK